MDFEKAVLIPLRKKYLTSKTNSGGVAKARTGSSAKKKKGGAVRPRRRAYGPF